MFSTLAQLIHGLRLKWYIRRVKRAMQYHTDGAGLGRRVLWALCAACIVASIIHNLF